MKLGNGGGREVERRSLIGVHSLKGISSTVPVITLSDNTGPSSKQTE